MRICWLAHDPSCFDFDSMSSSNRDGAVNVGPSGLSRKAKRPVNEIKRFSIYFFNIDIYVKILF